VPVQITLSVLRPKTMPGPPVARHTASPGTPDLHRLEVLRDGATHTPASSSTCPRKSQNSNLRTIFSPGTVTPCSSVDVDGLVAAHLLVEGVEELLARGGAGEGGAVEQRAAEAAEVEQALGRAVEGHAHAVEHEDDAGRGLGHALHGRLVGEEVAAVGRLFEVTWGLSPSPLVFTDALMPPCAHTECERFTGTSERGRPGPASQSLMTVIRPARPPPTTMTRRTLPPSLSPPWLEHFSRAAQCRGYFFSGARAPRLAGARSAQVRAPGSCSPRPRSRRPRSPVAK
jgi:hypothetical protein